MKVKTNFWGGGRKTRNRTTQLLSYWTRRCCPLIIPTACHMTVATVPSKLSNFNCGHVSECNSLPFCVLCFCLTVEQYLSQDALAVVIERSLPVWRGHCVEDLSSLSFTVRSAPYIDTAPHEHSNYSMSARSIPTRAAQSPVLQGFVANAERERALFCAKHFLCQRIS